MSWPVADLGSHVEILSGFAFKSDLFNNKDGLPLVRIRDVVGGISNTYYSGEHSEDYVINNGDLLIGMDGDFNREKWQGGKALLNQRVCKIAADQKTLSQEYLYHFLPKQLKSINESTPAVTVKHLSVKDIKNIKIPLPPLPEQQRIAAILDKADSLRRKNQQAIQLADQFLRAVFLDMFGDPVTNPKGWELKSLKELTSKIGSGSTPRGGQNAYVEEGISLIRSLNIHDDKFLHKNLAFITDKQAAALSNVEVEKHDVLLNITGASVCRCAMVDNSILPARVNQHVCIIRAPELVPEYLLHMLISASYKRYLLNVAGSAGATREALTKEQVENLLIPVPPKSLQEKFAAIKAKVKAVVITENEATSLPIFDSLSQKAFVGEL
ncbi:MAG: restriction endonuclease subunit S [Methylobacter sp.]|nr:restriction endonuclease subunit S [Methylobacter sp.]